MSSKKKGKSQTGAAGDEDLVGSFAKRLVAFSDTLDEREQALLKKLVAAALPAVERMQHQDAPDLLDDDERQILENLLANRRSR